MSYFSPSLASYIDATLGWDFGSYDALKAVFEQYMPGWAPPARSYATRILAGDTSALVHMTDTPELFGGELQRGHQLAQLRKNSGLTQVQVAGAMGVSQTRVSQIGHGKITESDASRTYSEAPALQSARRWPGAVSDWARAVGEPVRRRTYWHDTKRGSRPWPEARTSAAPPTLSPATPLPARRRPGTR